MTRDVIIRRQTVTVMLERRAERGIRLTVQLSGPEAPDRPVRWLCGDAGPSEETMQELGDVIDSMLYTALWKLGASAQPSLF